MSKIATTADVTVWECDMCGAIDKSPNAFIVPPGWWTIYIKRKTPITEGGYGGKDREGSADTCSKNCLLDIIRYQASHFVEEV